jgi:hypothetical protein
VSPKDRTRIQSLAEDVDLVIEQSSTHPVDYAVILRARRNGEWLTVCLFDNAHATEEHHEHHFRGGVKQAPIVTRGPVNDAIAEALLRLQMEYADIVRQWDQDR